MNTNNNVFVKKFILITLIYLSLFPVIAHSDNSGETLDFDCVRKKYNIYLNFVQRHNEQKHDLIIFLDPILTQYAKRMLDLQIFLNQKRQYGFDYYLDKSPSKLKLQADISQWVDFSREDWNRVIDENPSLRMSEDMVSVIPESIYGKNHHDYNNLKDVYNNDKFRQLLLKYKEQFLQINSINCYGSDIRLSR